MDKKTKISITPESGLHASHGPVLNDPISRRKFIKRTGGTAAAGFLVLQGFRMNAWAVTSSSSDLDTVLGYWDEETVQVDDYVAVPVGENSGASGPGDPGVVPTTGGDLKPFPVGAIENAVVDITGTGTPWKRTEAGTKCKMTLKVKGAVRKGTKIGSVNQAYSGIKVQAMAQAGDNLKQMGNPQTSASQPDPPVPPKGFFDYSSEHNETLGPNEVFDPLELTLNFTITLPELGSSEKPTITYDGGDGTQCNDPKGSSDKYVFKKSAITIWRDPLKRSDDEVRYLHVFSGLCVRLPTAGDIEYKEPYKIGAGTGGNFDGFFKLNISNCNYCVGWALQFFQVDEATGIVTSESINNQNDRGVGGNSWKGTPTAKGILTGNPVDWVFGTVVNGRVQANKTKSYTNPATTIYKSSITGPPLP